MRIDGKKIKIWKLKVEVGNIWNPPTLNFVFFESEIIGIEVKPGKQYPIEFSDDEPTKLRITQVDFYLQLLRHQFDCLEHSEVLEITVNWVWYNGQFACLPCLINQATLGLGDSKGRSIVQCSIGDKSPIFLCSLLPKKNESCPLNLEFEDDGEVVTFSVIGNRSVHLSGYFVADHGDAVGEEYESYVHVYFCY